jgi:TonB family protein
MSAGAPGGEPVAVFPSGSNDIAPPSIDATARWRHGAATVAALLVHAAIAAIVLLKLPADHPRIEDTSIPVEIIRETPPPPPPPPQAKAEPTPEAQSQIKPEQPPQPPRESGGDINLAPGRASAAPAKSSPTPEPQSAAPRRPAPPKAKIPPRHELALSEEPSAMSIPFSPPPVPPESDSQVMPVPPDQLLTKALGMSVAPGEGGGDPYLNAVSAAVRRQFVYPPEAESKQLAGTAEYEGVVDRQGNLLTLHLIRSAGSRILDQAGFDSITRAAPFGPVPPDMVGDQVGLIFTLPMPPPVAP